MMLVESILTQENSSFQESWWMNWNKIVRIGCIPYFHWHVWSNNTPNKWENSQFIQCLHKSSPLYTRLSRYCSVQNWWSQCCEEIELKKRVKLWKTFQLQGFKNFIFNQLRYLGGIKFHDKIYSCPFLKWNLVLSVQIGSFYEITHRSKRPGLTARWRH